MSVQQPQDDGWLYLEEYDTDMGTNFENIRDNLLEEVRKTAEKLGLNYSPEEGDYEVFFSKESSKAVLYAESWGGAPEIIAEVTAFECDMKTDGGGYIGRAIKVGNYSTVEVNQGALRGAVNYLERKKSREKPADN